SAHARDGPRDAAGQGAVRLFAALSVRDIRRAAGRFHGRAHRRRDMVSAMKNDDGVKLTDAQRKAQRSRSIAIALALIAFVIVMYVVTIAKMGPGILDRPM